MEIKILGGGVFGLSSAWALATRGHSVELFDRLPFFDPLQSSHDASKAIRSGYGQCTPLYAPLVAEARVQWRSLERLTGREIYHETGFLQMGSRKDPEGFEAVGARWLKRNGFEIEWLDRLSLMARWPRWELAASGVEGGWFERAAGWLDPEEALLALREAAESRGARCHYGVQVPELDELQGSVEAVLVCSGAWLPELLIGFAAQLRISEQYEVFLKPSPLWAVSSLPTWSLDLAQTGLYGFPPLSHGEVKVALHAPGVPAQASLPRRANQATEDQILGLAEAVLPGLRGASRRSRSCLYTTTQDGGFIFTAVPGRQGVWVAGGGSGHGFKFGSILGGWAADMLESKRVPEAFRWPRATRGRTV